MISAPRLSNHSPLPLLQLCTQAQPPRAEAEPEPARSSSHIHSAGRDMLGCCFWLAWAEPLLVGSGVASYSRQKPSRPGGSLC